MTARLDLGKVQRIAAVKLRGLGDTLLLAPALGRLAGMLPQARLGVFVPKGMEDLARRFKGVDEARGLPRRSFFNLVWSLRQFKPDLVVCFHASPRTAWAARLSGAVHRIVRNHSGKDLFSTLEVPLPKRSRGAHLRDLEVLTALDPDLPGLEEESCVMAGQLVFDGLPQAEDLDHGNWAALAPGASRATNRWPDRRWAGLAKELQRKNWKTVLLLGPGESGLWPLSLAQADKFFVDRPLLDVAAQLRACGFCVASDSGIKHLAASLACPTVTVWGSGLMKEWHPYDPQIHPLVASPVPCRPCFQDSCSHLSCLEAVEIPHVMSALGPWLGLEKSRAADP